MDVIREQMTFMLQQGLHDSAELLGYFLLSGAPLNQENAMATKSETYILFGDALFGKQEYRRALAMYQQALQLGRCAARRANFANKPPGKGGQGSPLPAAADMEIKYKMAQCHIQLKENSQALQELEGISSKVRDVRINLTLAKVYQQSGYEKAAIGAFKETLRQCPYAMEAIVELARMGTPAKDILALLPSPVVPNHGKGGRPSSDGYDPIRWLPRFVEAQCAIAGNQYAAARDHLSMLTQRFPNNYHTLLETARADALEGRSDEAILGYQKARSADQYNLSGMDEYALLVRHAGDSIELNRLTHELLQVCTNRPEPWVAAALYWEIRDGKSKAIKYLEKGTSAHPRCATAHLVKGRIHLAESRLDAALGAFRKAVALTPDLRSYHGLVRAYMDSGKGKEALENARTCRKLMPHMAGAHALLGDVYAQHVDGRAKARGLYNEALKQDPTNTDVVLSLAELCHQEGRINEGIKLLEAQLKVKPLDALHVKMGQLLGAGKYYPEAVGHYNTALSLNPLNEEARTGLERLEKLMKGLDPDMEEDEEDPETEDADVDAEDEFS